MGSAGIVKIILFDNASLGMVRQQQDKFYRQRYHASMFARPSEFVAIAKAFGVPAIDLSAQENASEALRVALNAPGPLLIRIAIAVEHKVLPMVPSGGANIDAVT